MNIHKHAITYAAGMSIAGIGLGLGLHLAGFVMSPLNYLSYLFYIGLLILAVKNWRESARGGFLTYGQAFGYSTWVAVYYSLIMALWAFVFFQYIAHDEIVQYQQAELSRRLLEAKEKYGLTDEMLETQKSFAMKFMSVWVITFGALFGNMLWLTLINLVVAAFTKKEKPAEPGAIHPPFSS